MLCLVNAGILVPIFLGPTTANQPFKFLFPREVPLLVPKVSRFLSIFVKDFKNGHSLLVGRSSTWDIVFFFACSAIELY